MEQGDAEVNDSDIRSCPVKEPKLRFFLYDVGEVLDKVARWTNKFVFPFAAFFFLIFNQVPDAVMALAFWAVSVSGRLTLRGK